MPVLLIDDPSPGVRRVRIDRPRARNAIDAAVRSALRAAIDDAAHDPATRALLIASENGMFCAGGDLPTMIGLSAEAADTRLREGNAIVASLAAFPKPVIAAVEGFAIGSGAGLALLADDLILADDAYLGFPFLKIGLVPDWGTTATLPWRAGNAFAARILRTAGTVRAAEAIAAGVADEIAPAADIARVAIEHAEALAASPLEAFARLKARLRPHDLEAALDAERTAQVQCLLGAEFAEGYAAFTAKRMPDFHRAALRQEMN